MGLVNAKFVIRKSHSVFRGPVSCSGDAENAASKAYVKS